MVFEKRFADLRLTEQEGAPLLGENVVSRHRVPRLAAHLHLLVGRGRDATEVAVGQVLDLVVVVEHHAPVAGHAKIFPQHVAGEDVRAGHLADGVAVLAHGLVDRLVAGGFQIQVERRHPALDVAVVDDDVVALVVDDGRGDVEQLGQQLVGETRFG